MSLLFNELESLGRAIQSQVAYNQGKSIAFNEDFRVAKAAADALIRLANTLTEEERKSVLEHMSDILEIDDDPSRRILAAQVIAHVRRAGATQD